jgi:hypothetical protein
LKKINYLLLIIIHIFLLTGCQESDNEKIDDGTIIVDLEEETSDKETTINAFNTSKLLDECEGLNIKWESDSIDVNGNGIVDYAVVGTLNEKDEYKNILGVMLDDGRMAILEFQGITGWREDFLAVSTAKLRYTDRDSIVIQFTNSTSNYGGSDIHVLSVKTDSDEVKIVEDATILDGGVDSVDYSSYEKTVIAGKTNLVYMTPEDELIQYIDKIGVNAVVVIGYDNNLQEIQQYYLYWNGEAWEMSEDAADAYQKVLSGELGPNGKIITEQTFEVNLSGLGNVIFASYEPEITQSPLPDVSFYILDEYGNVIEQLEGSNEDNLRSATDSFCDVNAVSFPDINGDGCKDIITICSYEYIQGPDAGNGFMEVRIYYGAEDGSFHYQKEMSEDASSALVEPSINDVLGFLGVKKLQ